MLPVKRRSPSNLIKPTRVWHVNLRSLPEKRGEAAYTDYDSVDMLVADGWVVD